MEGVNIEISLGGTVQVQGTTANVFIFGGISEWYGYSKMDLIRLFRGGGITSANLYINSPGGDLEAALAMYDLIKGSEGITTTAYLLGQCASAATVIASAADTVVMSEQCLYLVHKPMQSRSMGNADELRSTADSLDTWESVIVNLYRRKTGLDEAAIQDILRQDAYMNADTALALGFVDQKVEAVTIDWTLPTTGGEYFDWMTDADYWDTAKDTETSMTGAATFRSAIYNCVTEGKAMLAMPRKNSDNDMNIFSKIAEVLAGAGLIAKGKEAEAVTALAGAGMIDEIVNAAVAEIRNDDAATETAKPMTADDVMTAIDGMNDEQLAGLRTKLGIPETSKDTAVEDVANSVKDLAAEVARIVGKRAGVPPVTNGASDVPLAPDAKAETPYTKAQLDMMLKGFNNKQITEEIFQKTTGVTVARAREILAA